ncbi:MAG: hypothetical protein ACOYB3_01490 [Azonexus sp.]
MGKIEAKSAAEAHRNDEIRQSMLTDDEAETLVLSLMRVRGDRGATEDEMKSMLNEVIVTRFMATCGDLAAKGLIDVDYNPDAPDNEKLEFKPRTEIESTLREVLQRREEGGR